VFIQSHNCRKVLPSCSCLGCAGNVFAGLKLASSADSLPSPQHHLQSAATLPDLDETGHRHKTWQHCEFASLLQVRSPPKPLACAKITDSLLQSASSSSSSSPLHSVSSHHPHYRPPPTPPALIFPHSPTKHCTSSASSSSPQSSTSSSTPLAGESST
jgi:hypothetical protein